MNFDFAAETELQVNFLNAELLYLEKEIIRAKQDGDTKTYAALMRLYLNAQKEYMKLLAVMGAGQDKGDALTDFTANYDGQGVSGKAV